jgi:hypothetical protein
MDTYICFRWNNLTGRNTASGCLLTLEIQSLPRLIKAIRSVLARNASTSQCVNQIGYFLAQIRLNWVMIRSIRTRHIQAETCQPPFFPTTKSRGFYDVPIRRSPAPAHIELPIDETQRFLSKAWRD